MSLIILSIFISEIVIFLRIVSMQFVPAGNAFSCKQQRTQPSGTLRARKFTLSCNKKLRDRVAPGLINSVVQCYYQDSGVHPQSPCSLTSGSQVSHLGTRVKKGKVKVPQQFL